MIDRLGSISTSNWSRGLINNQQCLKRKTLWDPSSCNKKVKKPLKSFSLIWTCILVGFQWERNANMTCWSYFLQWNTPSGFSCLVQISKTWWGLLSSCQYNSANCCCKLINSRCHSISFGLSKLQPFIIAFVISLEHCCLFSHLNIVAWYNK